MGIYKKENAKPIIKADVNEHLGLIGRDFGTDLNTDIGTRLFCYSG